MNDKRFLESWTFGGAVGLIYEGKTGEAMLFAVVALIGFCIVNRLFTERGM